MDNLQHQPLLNLSSEQQQIISAHIANCMASLIGNRFTGTGERDAVNRTIYWQGQIAAHQALLTYDSDTEKKAREAAMQQTTGQGE